MKAMGCCYSLLGLAPVHGWMLLCWWRPAGRASQYDCRAVVSVCVGSAWSPLGARRYCLHQSLSGQTVGTPSGMFGLSHWLQPIRWCPMLCLKQSVRRPHMCRVCPMGWNSQPPWADISGVHTLGSRLPAWQAKPHPFMRAAMCGCSLCWNWKT